ncbi:hypothetical protein POSPLADRAFT_1165912 [Postia placenta MAD-698-R-SB12]|uniref:Uncharacterized protein n=1 Tax=Postia placenta MAD-698-R-SB12 TaxID=670580 RepID=A0A1X6NB98_9APHY|nr:hypothetical protein POSPLADRAFT_1165912 [Postia placenta MAD-698-R-SB12]OSX65917.1 hypothetical protein POSPLADRAFT_1165912 [Postia placenta MAD-698-R-SB12]
MEVALNALDATADCVTTTAPFAKPALKALAKFTPHGALKRGDRAQASTLNMLEDTSDIMENGMHNILQNEFDDLRDSRNDLANLGRIQTLRNWSKFSQYASDAVHLNKKTVTSSQAARSDNIWKRKGLASRSLSNGRSEPTPISDTVDAPIDCPRRADDNASVDITSVYEDPFRETASVVVSDQAFKPAREPSIAESESIYSDLGEAEHDDSFRLHTLRQSDGSR